MQTEDIYVARGAQALEYLFGELETEEDANMIHPITSSDDLSLDLWRILSHPCSKLRFVLTEHKADALAKSGLLRQMRRWCEEGLAKEPLDLQFGLAQIATEKSREAFEDLVKALQVQNNRVNTLGFSGGAPELDLYGATLRPILEHQNNEVESLFVGGSLTGQAILSLSKSLTSSNCKLKEFSITDSCLTLDDALCLIGGLSELRCLERIRWAAHTSDSLTSTKRSLLLPQLIDMLLKPENTIRLLQLLCHWLNEEDTLLLARTLTNIHCRVECLALDSVSETLTMLQAICRYPTNRLTELKLDDARGIDAADGIKEYLSGPICSLTLLECHHCRPETAHAIADALKVSSTSRLRVLYVGKQPLTVLQAFTESLRSHSNKLTTLNIWEDEWDEKTLNEFYRAVRVSNLTILADERWDEAFDLFAETFNKPFLQVLYTLLAVRQVPRLGQSTCWVRILPFQDIILRLVDTLGWPLDDLRVP